MAKVKERKSESWKPGLFHDDGFISKNKKRKDKRMSLNLSAKKIDTDEFIPIKKSALALAKTKDGLKSTPNKFLSPALDKKNTPKKKDTPLPVSGNKKQKTFSTPVSRKFSLADTVSAVSRKLNGTPKSKADADTPKKNKEAAGTPKAKPELAKNGKVVSEPVIKSSLKKKAQKFIDQEAEEGEEPVTSKEVKPYVKGQKRKSISFKFDEENDSYSDSDESDDLEDISGPRSFVDEEASEGEETDESDSDVDEDDGEDSDTFKSFLAGESDDDESGDEEVSDEEDSDVDEDDDSDEEDSDDDDEDDDSDEEDSDDSDAESQPKALAKKTAPGSQNKKNDVKSLNGDIDSKQLTKSKKSDIKAESKPVLAPVIPSNQIKKEAVENVAKKIKTEVNVDQKANNEEKKSKKKDSSAVKTSEYAGFIKHLPSTITSEKIEAVLSPVIGAENIVSVVLKKNNKKKSNRCFVYVSNEDSLDNLENRVFTIGEHNFKIFKARESKKLVKNKPLIFLPRVPLSIDNDKVKKIIESDIGAGNVLSLKRKKENTLLKTRNLVIEVPNEEIMKNVLVKGSYTYKGTDIIVRQAFESGFNIPLYKAVFADIPENTTEAALKKAVESKLGQGTVLIVKFSFRNKKFAFVNLNSAESLNKLLDPGTKIVVNSATLRTLEFKPRLPGSKRGSAKKKDAESPAAKKPKVEESSPEPKSKKSKKGKGPGSQPNSPPPKSVQNTPKQKNKGSKQSQNNAQNSPKKPNQQQNSPSSPPKNKKAKNQVPDKKSNLNQKLEAKKNKLKNKKNKQADASD